MTGSPASAEGVGQGVEVSTPTCPEPPQGHPPLPPHAQGTHMGHTVHQVPPL